MRKSERNVYRHTDLARILAPSTVAVVGASENPLSVGGRVLANLVEFSGEVGAVNPRHNRIGNVACYPSLNDLPFRPDLVVAAVSRENVRNVVEQSAQLQVSGVLIFASGFAETGVTEPTSEQAELLRIARAANMRIVGPNTVGYVNHTSRLKLTFAYTSPVPVVRPQSIGLISQSGAIGFSLAQAAERGVSFSHVLTCGNSSDVDVCDYISYLADDPYCTAVACVLEGLAAPDRFLQAAAICRANGKPLIVCKLARSERGARAAMSHTGSLAGSDAIFQALLTKAGAISVDAIELLVSTAAFFCKAGAPKAAGIAGMSSSGGTLIVMTDIAERRGTSVPELTAQTQTKLTARLPDFATAKNPLDITAQIVSDRTLMVDCADILLGDAGYGALVIPQTVAAPNVAGAYHYDQLSAIAASHDKMICTVWISEWLQGPGIEEAEGQSNVAVFRSMEHCLAALEAWSSAQRAPPVPKPALLEKQNSAATAAAAAAEIIGSAGSSLLTERSVKAMLRQYGVAATEDRLVTDSSQAVRAAEAFGYPVALKIELPDIAHKTESGGIKLNLADASAVTAAYEAIMAGVRSYAPGARIEGVLVQPMIPQGVEIIAGGKIDPDFGPILVVGLGGIWTELLDDTVTALAPVSVIECEAMLKKLKFARILDGFRSAPPVNRTALAKSLSRISELIADQQHLLAELDINPLICRGDRIIAADGLAVRCS